MLFKLFFLATLFHSFSDTSLELAYRSSNVSAMGQISIVKLHSAARELLLPAPTVVQVWVERSSYE